MLRKDAHLAEEKLVVNDTARARRVRKRTLCSLGGTGMIKCSLYLADLKMTKKVVKSLDKETCHSYNAIKR